MPRDTPRRPIWDQKSTLERKKNVKNGEKYQLDEDTRKYCKKYRNRTLQNLEKYGFVYTKRMFLKERVVKKT